MTGRPPPIADVPDGSRRVLASQEVWRGRVMGVRSAEVDLGDGAPVVREWVDHPGSVAIVALDDAERVLLLRQYRHPVRAALWEVPAGLLDHDGEDPLAAAQRELAEEADLRAGRWDVLVDIFCTPGGSNESLRVFLARGLVHTGVVHERTAEEAELAPEWVPLDDAVAAILAGRMHSPSATAGLLALDRLRQRGYAGLRPAHAPWFR